MSAFKAKHLGRCGKCHDYIYDGEMIVRMEKPVSWIERRRLIPYSGGRFFVDQKTTQYAHEKCPDIPETKTGYDGMDDIPLERSMR